MDLQKKLFLGLAVFSVALFLAQGKLVYTAEEIKALSEFRVLVKDLVTREYQTIDSFLIRWLRATKLDVNAAVRRFAEAQAWRKEVDIETPVNESIIGIPNFVLTNYFLEGVDNEGRTVLMSSIGKFDLRKMLLSGKTEAFVKLGRYVNDQAVKRSAEAVLHSNGTLTDSRIVTITDLTGFSLRNHACLACIPLQIASVTETEKYFPGAAALSVFINTPKIALPLTEILTSLASDESKMNLRIFGTDRKEWSDFLLKRIPANQLTYQFGGTRVV